MTLVRDMHVDELELGNCDIGWGGNTCHVTSCDDNVVGYDTVSQLIPIVAVLFTALAAVRIVAVVMRRSYKCIIAGLWSECTENLDFDEARVLKGNLTGSVGLMEETLICNDVRWHYLNEREGLELLDSRTYHKHRVYIKGVYLVGNKK